MGDGTADGVRVDSLAEWQAAAEEVRRLERVAQGKRETLLSAARADALAQGELGAGRRLLAGLERALVEGTALAGPSPPAPLTGTQALKHGRFATGAEIRGEARKVPVEDWGGADLAARPKMYAWTPDQGWTADEIAPSSEVVSRTTEILTVHPGAGDEVRMDDSPAAISAVNEAGALLGRPAIKAGEMKSDADPVVLGKLGDPSGDVYWQGSLKQDVHGRVTTTGPTKLQPAKPDREWLEVKPITSREAKIARKAREASDPADYWSGKARNPRRWWQFWRKK